MSLDVSLYEVKPEATRPSERAVEVFEANITHNLTEMAREAGIDKACWRPEELDPPAKYAKDIIPLLKKGLQELKERPGYFSKFNAPNGWGTYAQFVPWVAKYLYACQAHPEAEIEVDR